MFNLNTYSSLGTYQGGKSDHRVFFPNSQSSYFSNYNADIVNVVGNDLNRLQKALAPRDPASRRQFRYDDYFPDSTREESTIPHSLSDLSLPNPHVVESAKEKYQDDVTAVVTNGGSKSSGPSSSCSVQGCGKESGLANVMDPCFNLREVAKQCILLEDHLFHPERRCKDCIAKHALTIEGFLEEAVTLDKDFQYTNTINEMIAEFKGIAKDVYGVIAQDAKIRDDQWVAIAQKLRQFRKPVCQKYATNM